MRRALALLGLLCMLQLAQGSVNCASLTKKLCKKEPLCTSVKLKKGECLGNTCHPANAIKKKGKYCVDFSCSNFTKQKKCKDTCRWSTVTNSCATAPAATQCSDTTDKKECTKTFPKAWNCKWDRKTDACVSPGPQPTEKPTPPPVAPTPHPTMPTEKPTAPPVNQSDCFTDLFTMGGVGTNVCSAWGFKNGPAPGPGQNYPLADHSGFYFQGIQTASNGEQYACWFHTRNQQWMNTNKNGHALVNHFGFTKYSTPTGDFKWCYNPTQTSPCAAGACNRSETYPSASYFSSGSSAMWGCCGGNDGGYMCVYIDAANGDDRGSRCQGYVPPTPKPTPPPTPKPTDTPKPTPTPPPVNTGDCFGDLYTGNGVGTNVCSAWGFKNGPAPGPGQNYPLADHSGFWWQGIQTASNGDKYACWFHTRNQQWMDTNKNANKLVSHFGFTKFGTPQGSFKWCHDPSTTTPCGAGACAKSYSSPSNYFSPSSSSMWGCCGGKDGGYMCVYINAAAGDDRGTRCAGVVPSPVIAPTAPVGGGDCFKDLYTGVGVTTAVCSTYGRKNGPAPGPGQNWPTSDHSGFWYQGVQTGSNGEKYACWWHTRNQQWMNTSRNANKLVAHFGFSKYSTPRGAFKWCHDPATSTPCGAGTCAKSYSSPSNYFSASSSSMWGCCGGNDGGYMCVYIDAAAGDDRGSRCP